MCNLSHGLIAPDRDMRTLVIANATICQVINHEKTTSCDHMHQGPGKTSSEKAVRACDVVFLVLSV